MKAATDIRDYLTVRETAARMRRNPETIYNYIHSGKLRHVRDGNRFLVHPDWIAEYLEKRTWTPIQARTRKVRA